MGSRSLQLELFSIPEEGPLEISGPDGTRDPDLTFYFGAVDRSGMHAYVHLIQAPDDPERSERGPGRSLLWRGLNDHSAEQWAARIIAHLEHGKPRTFNRIMVELSDFPASVAFGTHADQGLWLAVEREQIVLTTVAPILFCKPFRE